MGWLEIYGMRVIANLGYGNRTGNPIESYYRSRYPSKKGTRRLIIVFDITNRASFDKVDYENPCSDG